MPILFLNTATRAPLGADTWIHAHVMRRLDRRRYQPIAACAFGAQDARTPTYNALHDIPDLQLVRADLGPELHELTLRGKIVALFRTLPALWTVARLCWLIRRRHVRVVHTSDRPRDAFVAVLLSRLTRARSIVHVHVGYDPAWMGRLLRWSLANCDALVAISDFVGRSLTDRGIDPARVHVVHNGIDVESWHPEAGRAETRRALGVMDDAPMLLTVCRLFPEKGAGEVIEAVARLLPEHPGLQLFIVGTDITPGAWFSAELRHRTAELELGDRVTFLGHRKDIERLMAACDVFVMPSTEEPFGLVFCEAMAMHRPVVALADGGTVEVVGSGDVGLLSERGDLDGLVANLDALLKDPERRAAMGRAGRASVDARFTTKRMADDVAALYTAMTITSDGQADPNRAREPRNAHLVPYRPRWFPASAGRRRVLRPSQPGQPRPVERTR